MPKTASRARRSQPLIQRSVAAAPALELKPAVIAGTVAMVTLVFWRAPYDAFGVPKLSVMVLGALTLIGIALWRTVDRGAIQVPRSPATIMLGVFIAAGVIATLLSSAPASSLIGEYRRDAGLIAYTACALLFLGVLRFDVPERLHLVVWAVALATAVVVSYGFVQVVGHDPLKWVDIGITPRISTLGQPNIVAGYLGIVWPLLVWGALSSSAPLLVRWGLGALAAATVLLAFASKSFQGPVAIAAAAIVLAVVYVPMYLPRIWRWFLVAGLVIVAVLVVLPVSRDAVTKQLRDGMQERTYLWHAGEEMVADRPILGDGFGAYARDFSSYRPAGHTKYGFLAADVPHDVPLALFVGGGVLLGLSYLTLVGYTALCLVRGLRNLTGPRRLLLAGFGASWLAYQVQSFVSFDTPAIVVLHFVSAGAVILLATSPDAAVLQIVERRPNRARTRRGQSSVTSGIRVAQIATVIVLIAVGWFALRPLRADLAAGRSAAARSRGDAAGAVRELEVATDLASWEATYWGLDAAALVQADRSDDALVAGEKAARRAPSNVQYALSVAGLAVKLDRDDVARYWYRWAVDHDPNNVAPTQAAVDYFLDVGRKKEAMSLALSIVHRKPDVAESWILLSRCHLALGDLDRASSAVDRALSIDAGSNEAVELRAAIDVRQRTTSVGSSTRTG